LIVIVFGLVSLGALFAVYQGQLASRRAALVAIAATVVLQLIRRLLHLALAPPPGMLRLVSLDDVAARAILTLTLSSIFIAVIGYFTTGLLDSLGLPEPTARLFRLLIPTAVMAILVIAIWRGRADVAERLKARAGPERRITQHLVEFWYVPALIYTLLVWLLWTLNVLAGGSKRIGAGVITLLIVLLYPTLIRATSAVMLPLVGSADKSGERQLPQSIAVGQHLVLLVAAIMILAGTWGVPVAELFDTPIGHEVGRAALHIAVAIVLAFAVWEFFERLMLRHVGSREVDGTTVAASARLRTLLPLFRIFVAIGLVTIATMVVLSSIGVDIGPMLAGAGVVGLAIGFGTQTLVRDVVSGILFMLEDAFRVGDYVEVDRMRGTVEVISLRSMRLRHHRGPVHTLPYGQIRALTNYTRDWVIDKIEITVPHGTDVELVRKLLKKIGQELSEDPEIGPKIIEPLKSQGIAKITDGGLVIRIKFTAQPRENFVVRRKALSRIVEVFHENGIELGQARQVEVRLHSGEDDPRTAETSGTSDPVEAAAAVTALPVATGTGGAQ
jgi:small-conductance mechanosensitive channel